MQTRTLYFNADLHRYVDEVGNHYTSTTTLIDKYADKFSDKLKDIAKACEAIGRNPRHKDYEKYRGKKAWQIESDWKRAGDEGRDKGTKEHAIAEDSIDDATNFKAFDRPATIGNDYRKLFSVNDLITNSDSGVLDYDIFNQSKLAHSYPIFHNVITQLAQQGWRIYSEIAVYHPELLISGLIDVPLVRGDEFIILDWKTYNAPVRFDAGYYYKDKDGKITDQWIAKDTFFKYPIHNLPDSKGNKCALQLSIYARLFEYYGYKCRALLLGHMTHDVYTMQHGVDPSMYGKRIGKIITIPYLKDDVDILLEHHKVNNIVETKQTSLI